MILIYLCHNKFQLILFFKLRLSILSGLLGLLYFCVAINISNLKNMI